MSERWRDYMKRGIESVGGLTPFALSQWQYLFPVFLAIKRALPAGGRVLDVGCGAGAFTSLLAHHAFDVTGIDEDEDIVAFARETACYFHSPARIERASAFDLSQYQGRYDLAVSFGVVEHFDMNATVSLVEQQLRCAPVVVVVVPSPQIVRTGTATDERLYTRRQVATLVGRAGCRVRESFVFGEVPGPLARTAERALPAAVYRRFKHLATYGMSICCMGERR